MLSAASLRDLWKAHHRDLAEIPIRDTTRIQKYREALALYKEAAAKNQEATENKQNVTLLLSLIAPLSHSASLHLSLCNLSLPLPLSLRPSLD
jgi:hypothetical protein